MEATPDSVQNMARERSRARSRPARSRLLVVSNRLPFAVRPGARGRWNVDPGSGGLVTALLPVLGDRGGTWIGWPGACGERGEFDEALAAAGAQAGYTLAAVDLSDA